MIYLLCIAKVYKFLLEKILTLAGSISALLFFYSRADDNCYPFTLVNGS